MSTFDIFFRCDNNAKWLLLAKEKKEKRKEKGFPIPFPKRKEINKEKKVAKPFGSRLLVLRFFCKKGLTTLVVSVIMRLWKSYFHLSIIH